LIAAELCPERSKNISDYDNGDYNPCHTLSTFRANPAKWNHLREKVRLIIWLGIVTEIGVSYEASKTEAGWGQCAPKTDQQIAGRCIIREL